MSDKLNVFISYKKHNGQTPAIATNIAAYLEKHYRFRVFIDANRLDTADQWAQRLYNEIHKSDVLVLLLEPETAHSEWVQREVDFARGASVSILPLLVVDPKTVDVQLGVATKKLALDDIQHSRYFEQRPEEYERLASDIRRLAGDTRTKQKKQHGQREQHWFELPTESLMPRTRVYQLQNSKAPNLQISLTVGNVFEMEPGSIDVIINSENDFLQMARFYEANTLSARLRRLGAYFNDEGFLLEDTVQKDLLEDGKPLPIPLRQVIVKRAGHERGALRAEHKIKLIIHAITVQFDIGDAKKPVKPLSNEVAFEETIERCLRAINTVNGDAALRESIDPSFDAVRTIAVPMFGTGMGGQSIKETAPMMVRGLHRALSKVGAFTLQELHLLVYSIHDVGPVQEALDETFKYVK